MKASISFVILTSWIMILVGTIDSVSAANAEDVPHKLLEIVLPGDALPEGCELAEGIRAVSPQASTQYTDDFAGGITGAKPVARQAQSMHCGKDEGTIFYYEYATRADAEVAFRFIRTLIWGEDHPTSMHPELIEQWGNILVVTSFRHPQPISAAVMGRVQGALDAGQVAAGVPRSAEKDFEKAKAAYLKKEYRKAEKYFRALAESMPGFGFAHLYLGHCLFYQERYREATPEYEKALALSNKGERLELRDERILNDQLGMAYGLSGRLDDAKTFFEAAIKKDPEYPLYYFNLACAQAEQGDLDGALLNLKLSFERRAKLLPGESYPNPRQDDSFKKYLGNARFEALMKEIGY